jgi:hypothetical protein
MPADPKVVLHFRGISVALLCLVAAAVGIYSVGLFGDLFEANPIYTSLSLTSTLGIDVLGAIAPLVAASAALAIFLKTAKSPLKKLLAAFSASMVLAFLLCHISPDGVASYPLLFALSSSIAAAAVNVYPKPFSHLRNNLAATFALTLVCVPLSMLIVDFAYSPYFANAVVGGNGLTDGLLLSTLYAPFTVTVVFSALSYTSQMLKFVEKSRVSKKMNTPVQTGASVLTPQPVSPKR